MQDASVTTELATAREVSDTRPNDQQHQEEVTDSGEISSFEKRRKKKPTYLEDYYIDGKLENDEEIGLAIFAHPEDPTSFEEAVKHSKWWRKAMDLEIEAI